MSDIPIEFQLVSKIRGLETKLSTEDYEELMLLAVQFIEPDVTRPKKRKRTLSVEPDPESSQEQNTTSSSSDIFRRGREYVRSMRLNFDGERNT